MAEEFPTIFDPATCRGKGLCEVSRTRTSKAHNLYYEIHGLPETAEADATKIVFIMGLNNSCFGWSKQIDYFGKKPGYLSIVMDNRGVGNSDTPSGVYSTSEMAKDILELLEFVVWIADRSLHVVGISMGGMIAQELSLLIPQKIVSLTLTSTSAGNAWEIAPMSGIKMFSKLFFVRDPQSMVRIVVEGLYPSEYLEQADRDDPSRTNRQRIEETFLYRYGITRRQSLQGRISQTVAAMRHHVPAAKLAEICTNIPKVAILTGDLDGIINPARSKDLHEMMPGSEYVLFEGGGHVLSSQFEERYNQTIERVILEGKAALSR